MHLTHVPLLRVALAMVALAAAGCGGGSSSPNVTSQEPVATPAAPFPTLPAITGDDWITFAHDFARSGYQQQNTGISAASVGSLQLRWSTNLNQGVFSSPLVYGGLVVVASEAGIVNALDSHTGKIVWQRNIGGSIAMTPTIDSGTLFVGNRFIDANGLPQPSQLYAIDITSGAILWEAQTLGLTHGSPVVAGGRIYLGTSGGDAPGCRSTGIMALDETTGKALWTWFVDAHPNEGGAVWSPISFDGLHLYFGTGNTCEGPVTTANGAVSLNLDGSIAWSFVAHSYSQWDDDTGGGVLLSRGSAIFINKNGNFYRLEMAGGALAWSKDSLAVDGAGMFSTPASDGTTIVVGTGYTVKPSSAAAQSSRNAYACEFCHRTARSASVAGASQAATIATDFAGNVLWSYKSTTPLWGNASIVNGVAFADIDAKVLAFALTTGKILWSYPTATGMYASPAVVPSGVYTVDANGHVYAFGLPSGSQSSMKRHAP